MNEPMYIYTDGSYYANHGGWSAIFVYKNLAKSICDWKEGTTNNRMEIMGVLESLSLIYSNRRKISKFIKQIHIVSDSQYTIKTCNEWLEKWIMERILSRKKNPDLWNTVYKYQQALKDQFEIKYEWIEGHAGHKYNEMADALANKARIEKYTQLTLTK